MIEIYFMENFIVDMYSKVKQPQKHVITFDIFHENSIKCIFMRNWTKIYWTRNFFKLHRNIVLCNILVRK